MDEDILSDISRHGKEQTEKLKDISEGRIVKIQITPDMDPIEVMIIEEINNIPKSISVNTLRNRLNNRFLGKPLEARLIDLQKKCKEILTWEKNKPTLQVGTTAHKIISDKLIT
jgi:hypothetical protein